MALDTYVPREMRPARVYSSLSAVSLTSPASTYARTNLLDLLSIWSRISSREALFAFLSSSDLTTLMAILMPLLNAIQPSARAWIPPSPLLVTTSAEAFWAISGLRKSNFGIAAPEVRSAAQGAREVMRLRSRQFRLP